MHKSLAGRSADLKDELGEHPWTLSEATMQLYRRYRIRPVVNMLASLFQLSVLLLFQSAVNRSSQGWEHSFLWLNSAAARDPSLILPFPASGLFIGVLVQQSPVRSMRKGLLYGLGAALMLNLLQTLGAAVNLCLIVSMGLNVGRAELDNAVRQVFLSLSSERSAAHARNGTDQNATESSPVGDLDLGGVVVQKMVPAEYAGVMFTEHPATTGAMMVELVTGLGEDLVRGNVTPDSFAFGKLTGQLLEEQRSVISPPPIDVSSLLALGHELEALFGQPQDIEWAYARGRFYLLQSRDIKRSIAIGSSLKNLAESERRKLLRNLPGQRKRMHRSERMDADEPVYVQSEGSELLPRPTPLRSDFMERLCSADGSTDLACQDLGIPYNVDFQSMPYLNTVFGWRMSPSRKKSAAWARDPVHQPPFVWHVPLRV